MKLLHQQPKTTVQTVIFDSVHGLRRGLEGGEGRDGGRVKVTEMIKEFLFVLKFFLWGILWRLENLANINIYGRFVIP